MHARGLDLDELDVLLGRLFDAPVADHRAAGQRVQTGQGGVVGHRKPEAQAVALAVLRKIADARAHRVAGRGDVHPLPADENFAAGQRIRAADQARHLGASRAHQSGQTEDFAPAQCEAHVLHRRRAQVLHLQHHRRVLRNRRVGLGLLVDHAAHHHADDVVHGHIGHVPRVHIASVAHDRHAVGDDAQLLHAVGDVDDAHALGLQPADEREQILDFRFGQRRGGLVHDENARVAEGQRLGDFHHLLLGDGERAHAGARADVA